MDTSYQGTFFFSVWFGMCDSEKMVRKAFLHIVINYRIEMTVGDTLKFLPLYALEMTPYIFSQWRTQGKLFESFVPIWRETERKWAFAGSFRASWDTGVCGQGDSRLKADQSSWWHTRSQGWLFCLKTLERPLDGKVERSVLSSHPSFDVCSHPLDAEGFAKMLVGNRNEIREGFLEVVQEKEEKKNVRIKEWK